MNYLQPPPTNSIELRARAERITQVLLRRTQALIGQGGQFARHHSMRLIELSGESTMPNFLTEKENKLFSGTRRTGNLVAAGDASDGDVTSAEKS